MKRGLDWYLERGFDLKTAEYFSAGSRKIRKIKPKANYVIDITFDNGEERTLNLADIKNKVTLEEFMSAHVDSAIIFNDKIDICADYCYLNSGIKER